MTDDEFFYGTQWTPAQLEIMRRRGHPPMTWTPPTREEMARYWSEIQAEDKREREAPERHARS